MNTTDATTPSHGRTDTALYWLLLLAVAAIYGTLSLLTSPAVDDLMFLGVWKSHADGADGFSWSTWLGYITELRNNDNTRLSNILDPIFLQFSPWKQLFPWITGAMVAFTVSVAARFAALKGPRSAVLAYFLAGVILFLPWRNNMFLWDYSLNYVWTGTCALGLIWCVLRLPDNKRYFAGALVLAVLTGWFHEGFAVPVGTGMVAVALLRRGKVTWRFWSVFALLVAVCSAALFCPGMLNRFSDQAGRQNEISWFIISFDLCLVPVAVLATAVALFFAESRRRLATPVFVMFFTCTVVGATLSLVVLHQPRSAYWPQLCALVSIAIVLRPAFGRFASSMAGRILAVALALATLAQGILSCVWQYRLKQEYNLIMNEFNSGKLTVYHDIIMPEDIPDFTLRFPSRAIWVTNFHYVCMDNYFGRDGHVVVPTTLRDATEANSQLLPGNLGALRKGDALWLPAMTPKEEFKLKTSVYTATRAGGEMRPRRGFARSFVTERGDTIVYLKFFGGHIPDLTSISIVE